MFAAASTSPELSTYPVWPFLFGAATAICFGFIAFRGGRSLVLWAISGGVFGFTLATLAWGVGHAAAVPYTEPVRKTCQMVAFLILAVCAAVVVILFAWWAGALSFRSPSKSSNPDQI